VRAHVAFNRRISAAYRHLGIVAPGFSPTFGPGQFVMVRPPFAVDPFLPRAFSIYRITPSTDAAAPTVEILYKVLGKGTQHLSRMEDGQEVDILGPLGNSFTVRERCDTAVLVAGGIGVPPVAALAAALGRGRGSGARDQGSVGEPPTPNPQPSQLAVFLGGRSSDDILCVKDFESAGITVHITTEDGSMGTRGLITDLLEPFLRASDVGPRTVFTCGPPGMLAAVARLAEKHGIACQVSVEANMACGFGACMGCAIEVRSNGAGPTYKLVCKDGPVFDSRELVWG
jgi:dihydroorotate dehydrogenase electron transfer subunit